MRILQINAVLGGSTGRIMTLISNGLLEQGNESFIAVANKDINDCKCSGVFTIGNSLDHKAHALFSRLFGRQGHYSIISTFLFIQHIKRIKPDIIHLHNIHSNYLNYPLLFNYIRKTETKVVITLHDCWWFTGKCTHFLQNKCMRWKDICGQCPRIHEDNISVFFDRTTSDLKCKEKCWGNNKNIYFVGCSKWIITIAQESILKNQQLITINNGIDISAFSPKDKCRIKLKLSNKEFVIAGSAEKWLNPQNQSVLNVVTNWLQDKGKLFLFGSNEKDLRIRNTVITGFLSHEQLSNLLSASDVFVNVTHADTYPTINMESICSGTPVITYNVGGSAEIVEDGITGYVINEDDTDALVERLDEIYSKAKKKYSQNCISSAEKRFSYEKMINEYLKLYSRIHEKQII